MKKRGLGRNLDVFLSRNTAPAAASETVTTTPAAAANELCYLPVTALQPGRYQPRREFTPELLQELAHSIQQQGIIQPLVVRHLSATHYEIIAGERRWRAAQLAGVTQVPVLIKEIEDAAVLAIALIENIQREDLNCLEEAVALQRLIDEFNYTQQQVAEAVGKSRTTITNLLRLLSLQPDVKVLLEQGKLEMGHARALLGLNDTAQSRLAAKVAAEGLSVRVTEALVRQHSLTKSTSIATAQPLHPDVKNLQTKLADQLGAQVRLQHSAKGKGKLIIHYNSLDELDGILQHIQ